MRLAPFLDVRVGNIETPHISRSSENPARHQRGFALRSAVTTKALEVEPDVRSDNDE
jgi:hypothetical protein